jgi:hypothetical protein
MPRFCYKRIPFTGWYLLVGFAVTMSVIAFKSDEVMHLLAEQTQTKLNTFHSIEPETMKIKKCEITISDDGFLRYRKTYLNGKQEYYSFNLSRLKSVDYMGSIQYGSLNIKTMEDDVIVQTYNDRSGNVDSMTVELDINLSKVEPEDLQTLHQNLFEMKRLLRTN